MSKHSSKNQNQERTSKAMRDADTRPNSFSSRFKKRSKSTEDCSQKRKRKFKSVDDQYWEQEGGSSGTVDRYWERERESRKYDGLKSSPLTCAEFSGAIARQFSGEKKFGKLSEDAE